MNILVTGGAGFIGTHLCRQLRKNHDHVLSLDLRDPASPVYGVEYIRGDARDAATLSRIFKNSRIEAVYHLAATVSIPLCQNDVLESYSHNVISTLTVLEACRQNPTPVRFAFSSSAALYGNLGDDRQPLGEEKIAHRFSSFYAAQKHAAEKIIELYHTFHRVPALIFRFFNVYGQGQDPSSPYSGVITIFTKLAKENESIFLHNSGVQTRDFIPVSKIVDTIASALALPEERWDSGVFNLGSGIATSIRELAGTIRDLAGSKSPIEPAPARTGDILHSLADIARAQTLLGLTQAPSLSTMLKELVHTE